MILCDVSLFRWKSMFKVWIVVPRIPRWSVVMWKAVLRSKIWHSNLRLYIFTYVKLLVKICDFGAPISSYFILNFTTNQNCSHWLLGLCNIEGCPHITLALVMCLPQLLVLSIEFPKDFLTSVQCAHHVHATITCFMQLLPKQVLVSFLCMP